MNQKIPKAHFKDHALCDVRLQFFFTSKNPLRERDETLTKNEDSLVNWRWHSDSKDARRSWIKTIHESATLNKSLQENTEIKQ